MQSPIGSLVLGVEPGRVVLIVVIVIAAIAFLVTFALMAQFLSLWVQALVSNARVKMVDLIGMRLRKVDLKTVVISRIRAAKAGLDIPTNRIEAHFLAGGRVINVVNALIASKGAKINLSWDTATAIDLAGRDIFDAVQTSVNPKVIDCPSQDGPRSTIDAVAKDGIQLKVKARVTVRTNLGQLVGGATEETVIARVGQGIVSTIGAAHDHKQVLENPDDITRTVMEQGLDAGTAFEILSIDIADIDVGENIGAHLQQAQAEADKKRFQAEAEKRRAMAMALEQENKAKIQENKALVVLAEAEVPRAMADAFRRGNLGIMDYYKMRNVQADTAMRSSIAGEAPTGSEGPSAGL